jgi:hypothetical protein
MPEHSIILADFDCFLTQNPIKGINSPLISNKLEKPTEQYNYNHYLIPRGAADICFPTDFEFL